jgi:hypothetical protein
VTHREWRGKTGKEHVDRGNGEHRGRREEGRSFAQVLETKVTKDDRYAGFDAQAFG